jgi:hypothetical protein
MQQKRRVQMSFMRKCTQINVGSNHFHINLNKNKERKIDNNRLIVYFYPKKNQKFIKKACSFIKKLKIDSRSFVQRRFVVFVEFVFVHGASIFYFQLVDIPSTNEIFKIAIELIRNLKRLRVTFCRLRFEKHRRRARQTCSFL